MAHPELASNWLAVLNWGGSILCAPKRGGKRNNLSSCIKKRVSSYSANSAAQKPVVGSLPNRKAGSATVQLAQAVTAKLEEGNLKAAIRLLVSDDTPALPSPDGLAKLKEKHPPASLTVSSLPTPESDGFLSVAEADIKRAVMSFPAGSSGGPDGLRPQHLKDLLNCREAGPDLLTALTAFINVTLAGRCPADVAPIFFGGRLIALNKKSGAFAQLPSVSLYGGWPPSVPTLLVSLG